MKELSGIGILLGTLLVIGISALLTLFFYWEWSLIRDVAIAFMPVYSAEALAWLGVVFGFGFVSKHIKYNRSD